MDPVQDAIYGAILKAKDEAEAAFLRGDDRRAGVYRDAAIELASLGDSLMQRMMDANALTAPF